MPIFPRISVAFGAPKNALKTAQRTTLEQAVHDLHHQKLVLEMAQAMAPMLEARVQRLEQEISQ